MPEEKRLLGQEGRRATALGCLRKKDGKLDQGVAGRPGITLILGSGKRAVATPSLVDTGASISVISQELAHRVFMREGRPYLLARNKTNITSATGHGLQTCGQVVTKASNVGVVSFHDCQEFIRPPLYYWVGYVK